MSQPSEQVPSRPEQVLRRQLDQAFRPPKLAPRPPEQTSPPESGVERREPEPRVLAHELVVVKWQDADGRSRVARARLIDRSKRGLGLVMDSPVPIHATVAITGGTSVRGIVQNCSERHDGYKVGLLRHSL